MQHNTCNKYEANTGYKILRTAFSCQPHISVFPGNFFGDLKLHFLPKYITSTYFTLKFFIVFDKIT